MSLLKAITTVGGFTMASRVLGFARDAAIAAIVGAGFVADAFFVAFKLPNLFRRLFAEGAFNAAFVPLYAAEMEKGGRDKARAFAEAALAVLLWSLLVFVAAAELAMPWLMRAFAPGFLDEPAKFDLTVMLSRITFPYLLFVSLVSLAGGILNAQHRFAAAAATPMLLNICLIGAVFGLAPFTPTPGHALAWGVFAAGVVQCAFLFGALGRAGERLRLVRPRLSPKVRALLKRALPVAVGAGVYQINLAVDMIVASFLPSGSISYLFYADRINQLPLGVVGVAVGTALLPMLSRQFAAGDHAGAAASQNRAVEFALLLTLPAAAALLVIGQPVVAALFGRGAFDAAAIAKTAAALSVYATGLPAYVLAKALTPAFYAREDTATPVKIAAVCMAANLVLNLLLMGPLLHVGIALATSLSAWLNVALLAWVLRRRGHLAPDARLKSRLPRQAAAAAIMAAALAVLLPVLDPWFAAGEGPRILGLGLLVLAGLGVFALAARGLGAASLKDARALYRGRAGSDA
ncbi:MAG: murein biosynthesis integral membrane protein MurJ [Alphaproteobacteria bacterium]|nr:murein biosynthesis integral membrane protein MurJ [Alphaproteobacteria bacterium]